MSREDIKALLESVDFRTALAGDVNRDWMVDAACRGLGEEDPVLADKLFFPDGKKDPYREERHMICDDCPVRRECEIYGNYAGRQDGAWGGLTENERRARRVRPRLPARGIDWRESGTSHRN